MLVYTVFSFGLDVIVSLLFHGVNVALDLISEFLIDTNKLVFSCINQKVLLTADRANCVQKNERKLNSLDFQKHVAE